MALFINNAILHILDNDGGESFFSKDELDIDSDNTEEFVTKHLKKLISNHGAKEATFEIESKVYGHVNNYINGEVHFKETSEHIAQCLLDVMKEHVDIPSADLLIVQFENDNDPYIGILKLNYKECFTHQVGENENGADNQIVKYRTVLPFDSGKVEEACIIPYSPMVIKLIEKKYLVNGEPTNYFSKLFLECDCELSKKEVVEIINEITDEINEKYYESKIETEAKVKVAVIEESIEEEGTISIANVAAKVFEDNEEAKNEFIELSKEAGLKPDIELGEKFSKQNFSIQKFKSNNGIEIKFPAELSDDPNIIEFINNEDGSITINLKNLRKA